MTATPFRITIAALATAGLVTGCSSGSADSSSGPGKTTQVATVKSPLPDGTSPAPSPAAHQRPLERADTTPDELTQLLQPYFKCLTDHGLYVTRNAQGLAVGEGRTHPPGKDYGRISLDCQKQYYPETVPERAAREDPAYRDKFDRWLSCMRKKGLDVQAEPDNPGMFGFTHGMPGEVGPIVRDCQKQAFNA
ncbi:MAG: hypothetical protein JWO79_5126 [Actinomycetia bacterium]|jgi:hypothetical protein|nr:hypothetical protein [Actinomycetes bacterium]MDQ1654707.1 hypothetical protein [Cryptosporangiaceae bacterium]